MDILKYLKPTRGYGGGGLLSRAANASHEEKRATAMSDAIRAMGNAKTGADRVEAMANYAGQGFDFNDLRMFDQMYRGKPVRGADGYTYYSGTGERVLPGVMKPPKPPKARERLKGADGRYRYVDDGSLVFPDVKGTPFNGYDPKYKVGGKDVDLLSSELYDAIGLGGDDDTDYLDPDIERDVMNRAQQYYGQTGNPSMSIGRAMEEVGIKPGRDNLEKYEGGWFSDDYYRPKRVREGSGRTRRNIDTNDPRVREALEEGYTIDQVEEFFKGKTY